MNDVALRVADFERKFNFTVQRVRIVKAGADLHRSIAIRPQGAGGLQTTLGYPCGWQYQFTMGIGNVLVQYTGGFDGIPNDIFEAVTWQVAQSYKKREAINVDSQNMGGGAGSVTYSKWDWTPEIKQLLRDYTKIVVSGT